MERAETQRCVGGTGSQVRRRLQQYTRLVTAVAGTDLGHGQWKDLKEVWASDIGLVRGLDTAREKPRLASQFGEVKGATSVPGVI